MMGLLFQVSQFLHNVDIEPSPDQIWNQTKMVKSIRFRKPSIYWILSNQLMKTNTNKNPGTCTAPPHTFSEWECIFLEKSKSSELKTIFCGSKGNTISIFRLRFCLFYNIHERFTGLNSIKFLSKNSTKWI